MTICFVLISIPVIAETTMIEYTEKIGIQQQYSYLRKDGAHQTTQY